MMGTTEGLLGTIYQLMIDKCIIEEVREYHRNLTVTFYDYRKVYGILNNDGMIRMYRWMGIPECVCRVIEELIKKWKTR